MFNRIVNLAIVTLKGGLRSKAVITVVILSGIVFLAIIPSFASFSMRQPREVATSLCLSMISFVLLVLTVFLSVTIIYKDLETRTTYFVLAQPLSRAQYLLGKFFGIVTILLLSWLVLTIFSIFTLLMAEGMYEADLPVRWVVYFGASFMEFMKMFVLAGVGLLFCSFSTNMFVPLFGTISIYISGNVIQSIYDYVSSAYGEKLPKVTVIVSKIAYWLLPNISAFDIKFKAIYNLPLHTREFILVSGYGLLYCTVVVSIAIMVFRRRQMF